MFEQFHSNFCCKTIFCTRYSSINALLADSTFPIELPLALVAIILVHLGVTLFDRFHPKAKDLRGLTYEGRRHQADAGNDILLEEMSLMHHAGHSGKDTEYVQHNFTRWGGHLF